MVSSSTTKTPTPNLFEKDHVAIESSRFIQISFDAIFKATKVSSSYQLIVCFLETALNSASETAIERIFLSGKPRQRFNWTHHYIVFRLSLNISKLRNLP